MISLDIDRIVKELNISADAFSQWKASALEVSAADEVHRGTPINGTGGFAHPRIISLNNEEQ